MSFGELPEQAAWRHVGARDGFEVVFFVREGDGWLCIGNTSAVEAGVAWAVRYEIRVNADWSTQSARLHGVSGAGERITTIESVAAGRWLVNGAEASHLDGLHDIDLESSAMTNALPMRRLRLEVDQAVAAPAVYVHAADLSVERIDQRYVRLPDRDRTRRFHYTSPTFAFTAELEYDNGGLVTTYPGIAVRVA